MTDGKAEELFALVSSLEEALSVFKGGSMRWGTVAANGVRFTLIPTDQVCALLDAHDKACNAMAFMIERETNEAVEASGAMV